MTPTTPSFAPTTGSAALSRLLVLPGTHAHDAKLSDSQLLCAEEAILPFDTNGLAFLQTQLDWAHADGSALRVRLVTGPSGAGKTRQALALCQRLHQAGWHSGFLPRDCDPHHGAALGRQIWEAHQPYCVVVDDAEMRQPVVLALLKTLLANRETGPHPVQVRVLLLARHAGDWWRLLPGKDSDCQALLDSSACSGPIALPALYPSEAERQRAYQDALQILAQGLKLTLPSRLPDLSAPHFAHPLYLHMAALLAVRGQDTPDANALANAMLALEQDYWQLALNHLGPDYTGLAPQAALLMTLATLCRTIVSDRDIEPIWRALGQDKAELKILFKLLAPLYTDRPGLQGLRPDLLGEALVASTLSGPHGAHLLDAVLSKDDAPLHHTSLTLLARVLPRHPELGPLLESALKRHLTSCAAELLAVCLETPSPLPQLAEKVYGQLPKQQRWQIAGAVGKRLEFNVPALLALKVLLCENVLEKARQKLNPDKPQTLSDYAAALVQLSIALHYRGEPDAALGFSQEAVRTYQTLAQSNPERFEPDWALALDNYASELADHGQFDAALAATQQAHQLYTQLAQSKPSWYLYEQERARLNTILWQWLASNTPAQAALAQPLLAMPSPEATRDLGFQWAALAALSAPPVTQDKALLQRALRAWAALNKEQQGIWEDFYVLLAALAEQQLGAPAMAAAGLASPVCDPAAHPEPRSRWMHEVARRLGVTL